MHQFRVVPAKAIAQEYVVVEVQLSSDALANDEAFTDHYGEQLGPSRYRYRSLIDVSSAEELARIREFITRLLTGLLDEDDRFVWFLNGGVAADDELRCEECIRIRGWVEDTNFNGSYAIFGFDADD